MTAKMKVPKLRFAEFEGEWEERKLGDITKWASGGTPSKDRDDYWNGEIPWISASSMKGNEFGDSNLKISKKGLEKGSKLAKQGSILILVRGSMLFNIIPVGVTTRDVAFNQDVKSIDVFDGNEVKYLLYWLIASESKLLNMVTGTGIGAGKLDLLDLKKLAVFVPTLPEQQKIATFLSTIDTRIQQLSRKKALLEQYKKGVMQQIFSQEIRFKDEEGKEFPAWEEKRLGEIGNFIGGGTPDTQNSEYWDGDILWFTPTEVKEGILTNSKRKITEQGLRNSSAKLLPAGALLITTRATIGDIGIAKFPCTTNQGFQSLVVNKNQVNIFWYYWFLCNKNELIRLCSGSTFPEIGKNKIIQIAASVPTQPEQQKIATFLFTLDSQINQIAQQLNRMQAFKKGLLQQMFV